MGILTSLAKILAFGASLGLVSATALVVHNTLTRQAERVSKKAP